MKTVFLFFLSTVYLFLAYEMETSVVKRIYFFVAIALLLFGVRSYLKARHEFNIKIAEMEKDSEEAFKKIPHTHYTVCNDYLNALLLDTRTNTLCFANKEDWDAEVTKKEIHFGGIYEVAIVEDDIILMVNTINGSQGGALLIKEDIFISEVEEEDEETEEKDETVSKLSLKIVIDDLSDPIIECIFMEESRPVSKDDDEYTEAYELCEQWYQKISVIIKKHELERVQVKNWQ
ncbi:hypothetical protein [Solibacillus sp. CAU 1738]|uniref:hypothetical protein n=1 Tax=Solibacillus sp. CAU 1738 TaxID=3140363 RepID=UPI00326166BE